jgi:hypothetical protein
MKKYLLFLALTLIVSLGYSQKTKLTVNFSFSHIVEGYDHNTKTEVLIDGVSVGVSPVVPESKGGSFSVKFRAGQHDIEVINYAEYEGEWEVHSIENNYSIDARFAENRVFKKGKSSLNLEFDLDAGTKAHWEPK